MKKIFTIILGVIICNNGFSQVAIGKDEASSAAVSLEFGDGNLGLGLPMVSSSDDVEGLYGGTMIYDLNDNTVKVYIGADGNGNWVDLTNSGDLQGTATDTSILTGRTENPEAKVSIGTVSNKKAILILEETDKAMILPKAVKPYQTIEDPVAGLVVYDPSEELLYFFNGEEWSCWGAGN